VSKRLTAAEKVKRDAKIVADRARGLGWALIADRYKLSERQAQNVWAHFLDTQPQPGETDPLVAVKETIAYYDAIIEELALVAESATHDAVRLGAIKARQVAVGQKLALMQAVGELPSDLGLFRQEIDVRQVANEIVATCTRHGASEEFMKDLRETLGKGSIQRDGSGNRS
jgi:hypothetical protein